MPLYFAKGALATRPKHGGYLVFISKPVTESPFETLQRWDDSEIAGNFMRMQYENQNRPRYSSYTPVQQQSHCL